MSVFDRAFLLGDGLFETIRIFNSKPFRWQQHWDRLKHGADFLKIKLPLGQERLRRAALELIRKNRTPDALLRLTLSRGVGVRGYSPKGANRPTLVMSTHPAPPGGFKKAPTWTLVTSSLRLPADERLAGFKSCNKLPQIMARMEADAVRADEALLLNTDGFVVEGAASNLFWIKNGTILTSPLASGILPGVTRAVALELCRTLKVPVRQKNVRRQELLKADGVFLSLSSWGIVEANRLDGKKLKRSPLTRQIAKAYNDLLANESDR
ncbi:MAG TPA: aminotransferase class IV [Desulfuromonadaceae bacterium]|nr:aminotransferase class IV [Desulfuromonadaceae bacterium]